MSWDIVLAIATAAAGIGSVSKALWLVKGALKRPGFYSADVGLIGVGRRTTHDHAPSELENRIAQEDLERNVREFRRKPRRRLAAACAIVVVVFVLSVGVLWALTHIGGPLQAKVDASIEKFGGSIWITATGLLGAFLAIALVGFGAIYILSDR